MRRKIVNTANRRRMHLKQRHMQVIKRQKLFFNFLTTED